MSEEVDSIVATAESRSAAEQKVLYQEGKPYKFLDYELSLCALPIFHARKVNKVLEPFKKEGAELAARAAKNQETSVTFNMDETAVNALIDTAVIVLSYHKETYPEGYDFGDGVSATLKNYIEMQSTTGDLVRFAEAQLEVQGESDFLLASLRIITGLAKTLKEAMTKVEEASSPTPSSSHSEASVSPGESDSLS